MNLKHKLIVALSAVTLASGIGVTSNTIQVQAKPRIVNPKGINSPKSKIAKLTKIHWFKKTVTKHLWGRTKVPHVSYHINRYGKSEWVRDETKLIDYRQYVDLAGTCHYHGRKYYIYGARHYHDIYKGKRYTVDTPSLFKNNAKTRCDDLYWWPGMYLFDARSFKYKRPTVYKLKSSAQPIQIFSFSSTNRKKPVPYQYKNPFGVVEDPDATFFICPNTTFLLRKDGPARRANDGHVYVPIYPDTPEELAKFASDENSDQFYSVTGGKKWPQEKDEILKILKKEDPGSSWQGEWIRKDDLEKYCTKGGIFKGNKWHLYLSNSKLYLKPTVYMLANDSMFID